MASVQAHLPTPSVEVAQRIGNKRIRVPPKVTLGELTPNNVGTLRRLNMVLFPIAYSDSFYKDTLDPVICPEDYVKLIFYQDLAVGNIVCRSESVDLASSTSEPSSSNLRNKDAPERACPQPHRLYILTLGILAPYRRQGLASKLIQHVISAAEASHGPAPPSEYKVKPPAKDESKPAEVKKKKIATSPTADKEKEKEKTEGAALPRNPITMLYLHVQVSNEEAKAFWEKHGFEVKDTVKDYYKKTVPKDAWLLERPIEPKA